MDAMKRVLSIGIKLLLLILLSTALYQEIFYQGVIRLGALYYFTIQSNILSGLCLFLSIFLPQDCRIQSLLRGMSLLAITITGIVYNFVLYKIYLDWNTVGYTYSRTILHLIMPVGFILDWLLFDEHRRMLWRDLFIWLSYPVIYTFCSIFMSFRYNDSLYFFFDIQNGFQTMLKWLAILFFSLLLTGCLYICVDRHLGRKTRDKSVKGSWKRNPRK